VQIAPHNMAIVAPALGEAISSFIKAELEMPTVARIFKPMVPKSAAPKLNICNYYYPAESAMIISAPADISILGRQSWG
jgi:hypothetical protein